MKVVSIENPSALDEAIQSLKNGEIILFPSETCYGAAVDSTNPDAVTKLLEYKRRPEGKAISIAVSNKLMAQKYVNINQAASNLYDQFLPGAVTIVSTSKKKVDARLESEGGTLGIRIPNYKFLIDLITKFGKPITATSANSAGKKTPYTVNDILEGLSEKQKSLASLLIDGGELPHNPPTTVIDTTSEELTIYRQGRIDPRKITNFQTSVADSVEDTIKFGEGFIKKNLKTFNNNAVVLLLNGELGVGKTQLAKGIGKGLGIDRIIKSPTYNYVNEYKIPDGKLYHFDAWRIQSKKDLDLLEFEKWFKPGNVIVVEWPSVIMNLDEEFFDKINYFYIDFGILSDNSREIRVYSTVK